MGLNKVVIVAITLLLVLSSLAKAATVQVISSEPRFQAPVFIPDGVSFPDSQFAIVGNPSTATGSLSLLVNPPGQWAITVEGGDYGDNEVSITANGNKLVTWQISTGHWIHTVLVQTEPILDISVGLKLLSPTTNHQPNSVGCDIAVVYWPGNGSDTAGYVSWRKNDGTQTGYDLWRGNYGSSGFVLAVPEPICLWGFVLFPLMIRKH